MPFEKEALRILNGGRRENEVMILMDVRSRCYGVIDFGVRKLALSGKSRLTTIQLLERKG